MTTDKKNRPAGEPDGLQKSPLGGSSSITPFSPEMAAERAECTVEQHCAELVTAARRAYAEGRRAGLIEGDEAGYLVGYAVGYDTGIRDTRAFKFGCREGYIDGFLDRLGDAFARQWEGDK